MLKLRMKGCFKMPQVQLLQSLAREIRWERLGGLLCNVHDALRAQTAAFGDREARTYLCSVALPHRVGNSRKLCLHSRSEQFDGSSILACGSHGLHSDICKKSGLVPSVHMLGGKHLRVGTCWPLLGENVRVDLLVYLRELRWCECFHERLDLLLCVF